MPSDKERALAVLLREIPKLADSVEQVGNPVLTMLLQQVEAELDTLSRGQKAAAAEPSRLPRSCSG
jgi:hypothetical protein